MIRGAHMHVQLSGGINDAPSLNKALDTGPTRVVLGTESLANPDWCEQAIATHGDKIVFALDVRVDTQRKSKSEYTLAARGGRGEWGSLGDAVAMLDQFGCARYVVTDVHRDGSMKGPNLDLYRLVGAETDTPIIASGGIANLQDLVTLIEASKVAKLEGAVVGRALYSGGLNLAAALEAVRQAQPD